MAKRVNRKRAKPGSRRTGRFFHIEVRPAHQFESFRVHDVGAPGGVERLAGRRKNGLWATQRWLIEKSHAHAEKGTLVGDTAQARRVLAGLGSRPVHLSGDRYKAKPRRNIPEAGKPTAAMRRAYARKSK